MRNRLIRAISVLVLALAIVPAHAQEKSPSAAPIMAVVHFEALNPGEPAGDRLAVPRRLAGAIVAQDNSSPHMVVDVGSYTGEFLEAFMEQFPQAHGQWTEPVVSNRGNAKHRLGHFGDRVSYVIGCPSRDISQGCVPKDVDVMLTSWLSIHQNLAGISAFYAEAAAMLPSGGWLINLDHVGYPNPAWEKRFNNGRSIAASQGAIAITEGPPVHHPEFVTPSVDQQIAAFHAAGFSDVQVVWKQLNTVLFMARKN